jgi:hypothetical protein
MTLTPTVATLTGIVDLLETRPVTITAAAIAHHLGQLNRYCGALELPFSVAQHSVLTYEVFRRRTPHLPAIHALIHDAPEYVYGDVIRPVQERIDLAFPGFRRWWNNQQGVMLATIRSALGIPTPGIEILAAVHEADKIALATEWRAFMPRAGGPCPVSAPPMRGIIPKPLPWTAAADLFRETLDREIAMLDIGEAVAAAGY